MRSWRTCSRQKGEAVLSHKARIDTRKLMFEVLLDGLKGGLPQVRKGPGPGYTNVKGQNNAINGHGDGPDSSSGRSSRVSGHPGLGARLRTRLTTDDGELLPGIRPPSNLSGGGRHLAAGETPSAYTRAQLNEQLAAAALGAVVRPLPPRHRGRMGITPRAAGLDLAAYPGAAPSGTARLRVLGNFSR